MPTATRIGTSGWAYKHWREIFYRPRLPQRLWLEFYADSFDTVELNVTFYRMPSLATFQGWSKRVPADFLFAVKGSRYITHLKRLEESQRSLDYFFSRAEALGAHCGPVLWQLPPDFAYDEQRLGAFLELLPNGYRHAFEFRHQSWFVDRTYTLLSGHNAALCIADSPSRPAHVELTADWTYLRFHEGSEAGSYTEKQLAWWAQHIAGFQSRAIDVYAYFNNDPNGNAIRNGRRLKELLRI